MVLKESSLFLFLFLPECENLEFIHRINYVSSKSGNMFPAQRVGQRGQEHMKKGTLLKREEMESLALSSYQNHLKLDQDLNIKTKTMYQK